MDEEAKRAASLERGSRYLAQKGEDAINDLQAHVDRARELLASGEVVPDLVDLPPVAPPYDWEFSEPRLELPPRIWLASVEDYATGEGMTVHFAAVRARDADEVRRRLAHQVSRGLADIARVEAGIEATVPFASLFLPPALRTKLEAIEQGEDRPAAISYFASYHANYA